MLSICHYFFIIDIYFAYVALIINLGQDLKLVKLSITNLENKLDRLRLAGAAKAGKPYLDPLKSPLTSMESFTDYDAGLEGEKYDFKVCKNFVLFTKMPKLKT